MLRTYSVSILCNSSVLNYSNLEFTTRASLLNHPLACYRHFGAFLHGQTCTEVSLQLKVRKLLKSSICRSVYDVHPT